MYREDLKKQFEKSVTGFHFLAYLMDPNYHGKLMNLGQIEMAKTWLIEFNPDFQSEFQYYVDKDTEKYPAYMFEGSQDLDPGKWWHAMAKKTQNMENGPNYDFCLLMAVVTMLPSSSAGLERIFSSFGIVWTKLRNGLGDEKAVKLVKLYRAYNAKI